MIVTVFRSRLNPEHREEYLTLAPGIAALARAMPGYISRKSYTAEDGERVTIVEFESEETQRAWAAHPDHRRAMRGGRERFYSEYRIRVCAQVRESRGP